MLLESGRSLTGAVSIRGIVSMSDEEEEEENNDDALPPLM